jgi:catechol 2,3-dioxygenase-like lactoylglutathione lyase family enzyme
MKNLALAGIVLTQFALGMAIPGAAAQSLPPPHFHHLMLNSTDPDAAIAFYIKEFPSTSRTDWEGMPALASPSHVMIVFHKVDKAPLADPNITAYWHFGWNAADSRKSLETFRAQNLLVAFYTDDQGNFVGISSDTYPYPPGVPGRTKAQLAEAAAQGLKPSTVSGNGYIYGPDGAIVEFTGNAPERFDHVHMWQDDPICAQLWYETHLEAKPRRGAAPATPVTEENCKVARGVEPSWPSLSKEGTYRFPTGGVSFDDVAMNWYMNQTDKPLAPTEGHLMDHVSLSVSDLDAWTAKLKSEGVTFLRARYQIGDTRAVMIEGPSREAIELIEMK